MAQVQSGDTVKVHYTGTLDDGTVFDASMDRDPLEFTVGAGRLIADFEDGIIGMSPGDAKTIKILSANAYGPYHEDMVVTLQRDQLPEDLQVEVDQELQLMREDGPPVNVRVADVSESSITLDANHPLAGQDLTFEIRLLEIIA